MPRLAIVISALGSVERLETTLVSVLENRPPDCEILVALQTPYADPYDLKGEVRFIAPGRGFSAIQCTRAALAATRAPFVHLLSSGCQVTEGWTDEPLARFGDRRVGSVAPLVWDASAPDRILAAGVGYRPSGRRLLVGRGKRELTADASTLVQAACSLAAFYRRAALDTAGGLSERLSHDQADLDLGLALKAAGFSVSIEPRSRILATAADLQSSESPFRRALCDERLFWRNLPAQGRGSALAAHAGLIAWELIANFARPRMLTQLGGRLLGCTERRRPAEAAIDPRADRTQGTPEHLRLDRSHGARSLGRAAQSGVRSS